VELRRYAETHFMAEERMMSRYSYDGLGPQRLEHERFVERLNEFVAQARDGKGIQPSPG